MSEGGEVFLLYVDPDNVPPPPPPGFVQTLRERRAQAEHEMRRDWERRMSTGVYVVRVASNVMRLMGRCAGSVWRVCCNLLAPVGSAAPYVFDAISTVVAWILLLSFFLIELLLRFTSERVEVAREFICSRVQKGLRSVMREQSPKGVVCYWDATPRSGGHPVGSSVGVHGDRDGGRQVWSGGFWCGGESPHLDPESRAYRRRVLEERRERREGLVAREVEEGKRVCRRLIFAFRFEVDDLLASIEEGKEVQRAQMNDLRVRLRGAMAARQEGLARSHPDMEGINVEADRVCEGFCQQMESRLALLCMDLRDSSHRLDYLNEQVMHSLDQQAMSLVEDVRILDPHLATSARRMYRKMASQTECEVSRAQREVEDFQKRAGKEIDKWKIENARRFNAWLGDVYSRWLEEERAWFAQRLDAWRSEMLRARATAILHWMNGLAGGGSRGSSDVGSDDGASSVYGNINGRLYRLPNVRMFSGSLTSGLSKRERDSFPVEKLETEEDGRNTRCPTCRHDARNNGESTVSGGMRSSGLGGAWGGSTFGASRSVLEGFGGSEVGDEVEHEGSNPPDGYSDQDRDL
uniref:Uncharacterized protein n=1 Tax=Chromera velia CCMP2878 TaxID=1169474 RepID=A0A0G4FCG2_9ALVE|eukprot:Cvel_16356.t1-p1 / transcript=Cvel_16356.t1 / gene=Cvel_16356 / organism=Chromera_velia_CCMP2878 / gene_product=hypothetical protein / transcript_product=hypothetical protein / location=Cvel_scaffold1256:4945-8412(+) / protein_length=577 / sequence_SO=supercontig / SO=protein_coding / is_pseudo=false